MARRLTFGLAGLLLFASSPISPARGEGGDWPCWRGPRCDGISEEKQAPDSWTRTENIAWRVEVPGKGHSSPIIWGDALFVTSAIDEPASAAGKPSASENGGDAARVLIRFDKRDGKLAWQREVLRAPLEQKHLKNSHASGTPACDGERVYLAFFGNGKVHVAAIGLDGATRWTKSPCGFSSVHGFCSSPVLFRDLVIVNCDQDSSEAALYAFDRATGEVRWKADRPNGVRSYVTPIIANVGRNPRLFVSGSKVVAAYDPANGRSVWLCDGPTEQCVATPVFGHGLLYITGGFPDRHILAIRPSGEGNITGTNISWRTTKGVAYVPSPLLHGDYLYVVHDETGVLSCFEAKTGAIQWKERLGGRFSSSLSYAAGKIYLGSEEGEMHIVAPGPRYERLAKIDMEEGIFASPAFSGGRMYLRTDRALYAIGPRSPGGAALREPAAAPATGAAPRGLYAALTSLVLAGPPAAGSPEGATDSPALERTLRVFDPPRLPEDVRLGKAKTLDDYHPWPAITDPTAWRARARQVREQVLVASGMWPPPDFGPVKATAHSPVHRDGYTVEKVFFESFPGFYVTGNLYRPTGPAPAGGRRPAVLNPHGHWKNGRFFECEPNDAQKQVQAGKEKTKDSATYPLQARCSQLARLGCVAFFYDMVGYADSTQIAHREGFRDADAELWLQSFFGLQTHNSVRAFDYLSTLPDVDPTRIGVTGASGGGTQTFILCAIDDRPAVAFPAVMVSTAMQGGCVCENATYLRVGTGNIELAALMAPKPLGMSGADDWTKEIETKGLLDLKALYSALGVPDNVMAKCFPTFEHNYNQVSRELMYNWMNRHLRLGRPEPIEEKPFRPIPTAELSVFDVDHPRPSDAIDAPELRRRWKALSEKQIAAIRPQDASKLEEFRRIIGTALRVMVGSELPPAGGASAQTVGEAKISSSGRPVTLKKLLLSRPGGGESVPAVLAMPEKPNGTVVVAVHPDGKAGALAGGSQGMDFAPAAAALLERGAAVLAIDAFLTGEFHMADKKTPAPTVNRDFAGFTFGYNRSLLGQRVHDILTAVAYARAQDGVKRVCLAGWGQAGVWTLLASARAGSAVERTSVELDGFSFDSVKETGNEMMLPGAVKYGGLPAFTALVAPRDLRAASPPKDMGIAQEAYRSAGAAERLKLEERLPPASELAEWLVR